MPVASIPPTITDLTRNENSASEICELLVLTWIAFTDARLSPDEFKILHRASARTGCQHLLMDLMRLVVEGDLSSIQLALEYLDEHLDEKRRRQLMESAIDTIVADGRVEPTELHVLRVVGDVLEMDPDEVSHEFQRRTLGLVDQRSRKRE